MPTPSSLIRRRLAWLGLIVAPLLITLSGRCGNVVTLDSDNVLIINGRKIFPIVFTLAPKPDGKTPDGKNGMQELADAGGTMFRSGANGHTWDEDTFSEEQAWEDAAAQHGLYCWLYLHDLGAIGKKDSEKEKLLRRVVEKFKDHPGMGVWKGADEPEWGGTKVAPLEHSYKLVRELDANHPFSLIQAPRGTVESLRPYSVAGDITGCDIYPISYPPGKNSQLENKEMNMVGEFTRRMEDAAPGKAIWMVLQIAWSGVVKPGTTLRFPTFHEERFMAYDAIINGARGLVFFGGNVTKALNARDAALGWNWTFWDNVLKRLMLEIGDHSPLEPGLVAPESKLPAKVSDPKGIEFIVREDGDDIYVIAARRSGTTAEVEFSGLPIADGLNELMYEEPRSVTIKKGGFKDWFAPYEVHVYRFKRAGVN